MRNFRVKLHKGSCDIYFALCAKTCYVHAHTHLLCGSAHICLVILLINTLPDVTLTALNTTVFILHSHRFTCLNILMEVLHVNPWILTSRYTWQQLHRTNPPPTAVWGQKENFHFYSQAICRLCYWRCGNNTGVGSKNKTAVYLPLLERRKWSSLRRRAVCFSEHSSLYRISLLIPWLLTYSNCVFVFAAASVSPLSRQLHFVWHCAACGSLPYSSQTL